MLPPSQDLIPPPFLFGLYLFRFPQWELGGWKALKCFQICTRCYLTVDVTKRKKTDRSFGKNMQPDRYGAVRISYTASDSRDRPPSLSLSNDKGIQFTKALVDLMDPPQKSAESLRLFKKHYSLFLPSSFSLYVKSQAQTPVPIYWRPGSPTPSGKNLLERRPCCFQCCCCIFRPDSKWLLVWMCC